MHDTISRDELSLKDAVREGLIAYSTAHKYIHEKSLPARKIGREWHVRRADLEALADSSVAITDPDPDELLAALSDPVREWAKAQAASAPPMNAKDARLVAAIFRRTAKGGAIG